MIIQGSSAVDCWKKAMKLVHEKGIDFVDENNRVCREYANLQIKLNDNTLDIEKPISLLNSFEEWRYPPLKEIRNVMLAVSPSPYHAYSYGPRIFNFQKKINQINNFIIPLLQSKPISRKAVVSLWDPIEDSNTLNSDAPGLVMLDFKLRGNKLNVMGVIRSNDLFFGWPANIYQMRTLQEYVSKKLGCGLGEIVTFSVSAHIFKDQAEYINKILEGLKVIK